MPGRLLRLWFAGMLLLGMVAGVSATPMMAARLGLLASDASARPPNDDSDHEDDTLPETVCPKCGGAIEQDDIVCPHCGVSLVAG